MKSILILVEQFTMGGLETHIRGEIAQLQAQGCQVHLAVGANFDGALVPASVASVTSGLALTANASAAEMVVVVDRIRGLVQRWQIDAIHAHPFVSLVPGMMAAELEQIPLAVTLHGPASLAGYAGPLYDFLVKALVLPSAATVVAVSPEVQAMTRRFVPGDALQYLPNGVVFKHGVERSAQPDPRWLVVSRLDAAKAVGVRDFISKALLAGLPGVVVAGSGEAQQELEHWVADQGWTNAVSFVGAQAEILHCMAQYAGVAGMGRVVLEALSLCLPVALLGYDGLKGLLDAPMLEAAAVANFSGRNLPTVSAEQFGHSLREQDRLLPDEVWRKVADRFDEAAIWSRFRVCLEAAHVDTPGVLAELYRSLRARALPTQVSFYHSEEVMGLVEEICCSKQYYDARVHAAWQACTRATVRQLSEIHRSEQAQKMTAVQQAIDRLGWALEAEKRQVQAQQKTLKEQGLRHQTELAEAHEKLSLAEQSIEHGLRRETSLEQKLSTSADELRQQCRASEHALEVAHIQLKEAHLALAAERMQLQAVKQTLSWRVTRPARVAQKLLKSVSDKGARYELLKAVYWRLPSSLRHRLNAQRTRYVTAHWSDKPASVSAQSDTQVSVIEEAASLEWLQSVRSATKVVVITCGFEFDELVNQRPINAAKYFAQRGYVVVFVAWQWSRTETLSKGCARVWPHIFQVPLYEFLDRCDQLPGKQQEALYLLTMPAAVLAQCVPALRGKGYAIVYDVMDEWQEFHASGQAPWYQQQVEEQLVLQSDVVCCVAPALVQKFAHIRHDIMRNGNGYSAQVMGESNRGIAAGASAQTIGYFGHLTDAWFDWKLVFSLASANPQLQFQIIGYGEPEWVRQQAQHHANLELVGKVHPSELNAYVRHWRAAIIPFVEGRLSQAVDPIKIYEYLYFGLPVFVTGIEHLQDYPCTIWASRDTAVDAFGQWLKQTPQDEAQLQAFLQATTWDARFDELVQQLQKKQSLGDLYVL